MSYLTRPTILYAQRDARGWRHFAPHPGVTRMYDNEMLVHEVEVAECVEEPDCYFAWWDAEHNRFTFVYPVRGLVDMCFPYGAHAEEARGRGQIMAVRVTDHGPALTSPER